MTQMRRIYDDRQADGHWAHGQVWLASGYEHLANGYQHGPLGKRRESPF